MIIPPLGSPAGARGDSAEAHDIIADPTPGGAKLDHIVHNAHRIELKRTGTRRRCSKRRRSDELIAPSALDHNTISGTTSKRQSGAPSRMITIPGSDRHRLEFMITIVSNS
jgi:hypothetical protein